MANALNTGPYIVYSKHSKLAEPFMFHVIAAVHSLIDRMHGNELPSAAKDLLIEKLEQRVGSSCKLDTKAHNFQELVDRIESLKLYKLKVTRSIAFYSLEPREDSLALFQDMPMGGFEFAVDVIIFTAPKAYLNIQILVEVIEMHE